MINATVSIIVPVYKIPKNLLDRCYESIVNQTYKNIEPIFVDDGSPDECGRLLDEYAARDQRIKIVHQKNGGLCAARNAGVYESTGEYITFVDGDDYVELDAIELMLEKAKETNAELVMCELFRDNKNSSFPYSFYIGEKLYTSEECVWLQEQLFHYNGNIAVPYAKLIRKEYIDKYHIYHDEKLRQGEEGLEFNFRLFENLSLAYFLGKPLYHYVYNDTSITAVFSLKNIQCTLNCCEKLKKEIAESKNKDRVIPWFYNRMMQIVVTCVISGIFNPALNIKFLDRINEFKKFKSYSIVQETLGSRDYFELSKARKIVLFMIKKDMYRMLYTLGKIRRFQKLHA